MPDGSNYVAAAAAPQPPKPPLTYLAPHVVNRPSVEYALQGPDKSWYLAMVILEPFPGAYTLTIWREPDRSLLLWRDAFTSWHGQLCAGDTIHRDFHKLLGHVIRITTGSSSGWSMLSRPITVDEVIELDTEGDIRTGGEAFSFLL